MLRRATPDDLDGIIEVFLGCWHESYARTLPARLVRVMSRDRADDLWRRVLGEDRGEVVVAVEQGGHRIRGVTRFARQEDGGGIIHSLYVDPHAQGGGVGARLLAYAESALASLGVTRAVLWVFDANEPAISFYSRHGWVADGTTRTTPEFGELERRLAKDVS